jgi:hypothetical protein
MTERRILIFDSPADVAREIVRLREGCKCLGNWTLSQVCFHLNAVMLATMKPGPYQEDTPEQISRKPILDQMLSTRRNPGGIVAASDAIPPSDVPDSSIDEFLETLRRFETYSRPFAPHRLYGCMNDSSRRRHQLIHCAHHLGYLVPRNCAIG